MKNSLKVNPIIHNLVISAFIMFIASICSFLLISFTSNQTLITVLYLLAILFISNGTQGYIWGVLSSLWGTICIYFFLTDPFFEFSFSASINFVLHMGIFIGFLITSIMTAHKKEQIKQYHEQEEISNKQNKMLSELTSNLLTANGLNLIIDISLEYISQFMNSTVIFYSSSPQSGDKGIIRRGHPTHDIILNSRHEQFIAHWVFVHKYQAGVGTDFCGSSSCIYLPLISHSNIWGVLGIYCSNQKPIEENKLKFLYLLISQVAMSIERQHLSDSQLQIQIETEKEKMRANLLRAVSHDLRTPLTGMIGVSETLIKNKEFISETQRDKLIGYIYEDSNWLLHMVENLLSVTRIREDSSSVNKVPEPLEEVVGEAIMRIKKRFPTAQIEVKVPEEFLMVPMDATLIEQVILNLIENALTHSESDLPIELMVTKDEEQVLFQISDQGLGIQPERLDTIFDGYAHTNNPSSDIKKGIGIGLSICKTIINAHGGTITAGNRDGGGAVFSFSLPLEGGNSNG